MKFDSSSWAVLQYEVGSKFDDLFIVEKPSMIDIGHVTVGDGANLCFSFAILANPRAKVGNEDIVFLETVLNEDNFQRYLEKPFANRDDKENVKKTNRSLKNEFGNRMEVMQKDDWMRHLEKGLHANGWISNVMWIYYQDGMIYELRYLQIGK